MIRQLKVELQKRIKNWERERERERERDLLKKKIGTKRVKIYDIVINIKLVKSCYII